jgi:hypothetical protein
MATSTAPGLAVALVHHGQLVWAAGYGLADPATGQAVTASTLWVPVIRVTSCNLRVLMDQPTEAISPRDLPADGDS